MATRYPVPLTKEDRRRPVRRTGTAAAAVLATVHLHRSLFAAPRPAYLGVLFWLAAMTSAWVAWRLARTDDVEAWFSGAAVAAGVAVGYVLSCTVGLPGLPTERWSLLGNTSTSAAMVFLAAAVRRIPRHSEERDQ